MLKKLAICFFSTLIILCLLFLTALFVLGNDVPLLSRYTITLTDETTIQEAFELIFSLAEDKEDAKPCHFVMDYDSYTSSITFSLLFYQEICPELFTELFYVYKYDYAANCITRSNYIGSPENLTALCPELFLGFKSDFRLNATDLFNKTLSEIESEGEKQISFSVGCGYSGNFDHTFGAQ